MTQRKKNKGYIIILATWFKILFAFISDFIESIIITDNQNSNNCVCKYLKEYAIVEVYGELKKIRIEELENISDFKLVSTEAHGVMYFKGLECRFISGGHGNGSAPKGLYKAYKFLSETREAFSLFGMGFQVPIAPQFKTTRTFLSIHFDGNKPGSLGCPSLIPEDADHATRILNAFKHHFEVHQVLEVEIC